MSIPAGWTRSRASVLDLIYNPAMDIVGLVDQDGGEQFFARQNIDSLGYPTGLVGGEDSSSASMWLFGASAQGAGKEKYAFSRLDTNAGSVARPTNMYLEHATNLGVTMTCDFHNIDAYLYGGGSNARYTANVRLYCIEGLSHFTGTNNQTLGGVVGLYGLGKSSGNAGTTVQVGKGVQGSFQNTGAGTMTLGAGFYVNSPTNSGGGTVTTATGLYIEDITVGSVNYAIKSGAGRVSFGGLLDVASSAPASAGASGVAGQFTWDSSYVYICTATNTWKRAALATW